MQGTISTATSALPDGTRPPAVRRLALGLLALAALGGCQGFDGMNAPAPAVQTAPAVPDDAYWDSVALQDDAAAGSFFEAGAFGATRNFVMASGRPASLRVAGARYVSANGDVCRPVAVVVGRQSVATAACRISERWRLLKPL